MGRGPPSFFLRIQEFHVQAEATDLFHQLVETLGHAGFKVILAFDDGLIHLGAPRHVI